MSTREVHRTTLLSTVARGIGAGLIGTAVMTGWQEAASNLLGSSGGEGGEGASEEAQDPWNDASAPAKLGRKILEDVFHRKVGPEHIGLLTNVMHWGYGTTWGPVYGLIQGSAPGRPLPRGLLFGTGVWSMSYMILVPIGLYELPWKYPPTELALDLSYHLAYGVGVGVGYALIDR